MTDQLAKQIFDTLITVIRENDFNDMIAFALPDSLQQPVESGLNTGHAHQSTWTEADDLVRRSENFGQARASLFELVASGKRYLETVKNIPGNYSRMIEQLSQSTEIVVSTNIRLSLPGGQSIDLGAALADPALVKVISLLDFIAGNSGEDDDVLLTELDRFTTNL
jgi:hypothetical protein